MTTLWGPCKFNAYLKKQRVIGLDVKSSLVRLVYNRIEPL